MLKRGVVIYEALLKFDGREIMWAIEERSKL